MLKKVGNWSGESGALEKKLVNEIEIPKET